MIGISKSGDPRRRITKEKLSECLFSRLKKNAEPANLVPADYGSKSALSNSLTMAVESIANKITLRRTSYQD
jgi:hypothetical protein